MGGGDFKDSTKALHNKAYDIAEISKHDGSERGLASMVY